MTDLINQLMNDEAVYRTAPATPGLLNIDPDMLTMSIRPNRNYHQALNFI